MGAGNVVDLYTKLHGAREAAREAKGLAHGVDEVGDEVEQTGRQAKRGAAGVDRFGRSARKTERDSKRMGRAWVGARAGIGPLRAGIMSTSGALLGGFGLAAGFKKVYEEGREAQKVGRATDASIRSTGAGAWTTRKHIERLAEQTSVMAAKDDEVIQRSALMLLSFRNIKNGVGPLRKTFDRTTRAAVDMAAGMTAAGKPMSESAAAMQLGKALNNPIKGMTRLQRVGIEFTDAEVKRVEALQKAGKMHRAQGIILAEVEKEYGGQAAAAANPVERLGVKLANMAERLGMKLVPELDEAADKAGVFIDQMESGDGAGGRFRRRVEDIWRAVKPVVFWFGRAGRNVFKFASEHPRLVKVAAALFLANKALRAMKFYEAIRGARLLRAWLIKDAVTAEALPGRVSRTSGKWAAAGKLLGGVFAASFIAQLTGIEDADPLLFLHPPSAGDPRPGHGDVRDHGRPGTRWTDQNGTIWQVRPDGTSRNVGNRDTGRPGLNPQRNVDRGRRGVNRTPKLALPTGGDTIVHNHFYVDGKEITNSVTRHTRSGRNRR